MKNRIALFICLYSVLGAYSQNTQLTIGGTDGKFYLEHTVVPKENWYSIGRLYNTPPHDIAGYNSMNFGKPLDVGTQLKIPLTGGNFDQKELKIPGESLIPIYHVVAEKEWMFRISSIYNDVPVTSLEKWNQIKRDDVKKGMSLIVGFLRVKTDVSPLAIGVSSDPAAAVATQVSNTSSTTFQTTTKPDLTNTSSGSSNVATTSTTGVVPLSSTGERVNNYSVTHSNGGFFSVDYAPGGKTSNGLAGTFKSTSGWTDGKYYALMNGVPVGTIIRVSGTNSKTIYAKVLGQLPEMKESAGLLIRISNAASAELGLGEGKFPVDIKY